MPKVYLRANGTKSFEWVDDPEQATADEVESLKVNLKQFQSAKLEQLPAKTQHLPLRWVISADK